ncbi:hypothetical protein T07_14268 [Trichinella nelsoni]|uniref:Uncharacterized protein n=1 Tax=Trichinella nelsoni TaxID=6336 RepID=A0A0V0SKT0_9BILA|nr:hypothetical protein T07_14268 [Trichinella nelsoni]
MCKIKANRQMGGWMDVIHMRLNKITEEIEIQIVKRKRKSYAREEQTLTTQFVKPLCFQTLRQTDRQTAGQPVVFSHIG